MYPFSEPVPNRVLSGEKAIVLTADAYGNWDRRTSLPVAVSHTQMIPLVLENGSATAISVPSALIWCVDRTLNEPRSTEKGSGSVMNSCHLSPRERFQTS